MKPADEDEAWRQIVENYGPRPSLDDPPEDEPGPEAENSLEADSGSVADDDLTEFSSWAVVQPEPEPPSQPEELSSATPWDDEGHFVPPPPPPIPLAEPKRLLAWIGVFGAPLLVLLNVVVPFRYPGWFSGLLFGWFVGGFVYLVATMPNGRDPWDDGSRL